MQHSFNIEIAKKIGIEPAIILNNLWYWTQKNKANDLHLYDDHYWTYNSVNAFKKLFPYMTTKKISYALKKLEELGLITTGNYNKVAYDRTKWYAITKMGESILQNGQMEVPEKENGIYKSGQPIPNINTNDKPNINTNNTYQKIIDLFNSNCSKLSSVQKLTDKRKKAIKLFLKEFDEQEARTIFENLNKSEFHTGKGGTGWKADFDWIMKSQNAIKFLEVQENKRKCLGEEY